MNGSRRMDKKGVRTLRFAFAVALALLMAVSGLPASASQAASSAEASAAQVDAEGSASADRLASTDAAEATETGPDAALDGSGSSQSASQDAVPSEPSEPAAQEDAPAPAVQDDPAQNILVECADVAASAASLSDLPDATSATLRAQGVVPQEIIVEASGTTGTIVRAAIPVGKTPQAVSETLRDQPGIIAVQPNHVYRYAGDLAAGVDVPDDPRASQEEQYYLYGGEFGTMKGADVLNAWNRVAGGSDVTVAVFDSGCRLDHEDLAGTLLTDLAYDAASRKPLKDFEAKDQDANGHGTAVAGLVGALSGNGKGIAGTGFNARLLPVKVHNPLIGSPDTATVLKGISYVANLVRTERSKGNDFNLRVANMSFISYPGAGEESDPALHRAIQDLRAEGVMTVAAGGDGDGSGNAKTEYGYPSDFPEVVGVTALEQTGRNAPWSDYNDKKDLSAPAVDLATTLADAPDAYGRFSGTSGASPIVAGVAALLMTASPDLTVEEAERVLEGTADEIQDPDNDRRALSGSAGAVNASKAIDSVLPAAVVDVNDLQLDPIPDQRYANQALEPDVVLRTADGARTLVNGQDYALSYENNVRAGTASVTIAGRGAYTGSRSATFEITPNLSNLVLVVRFQGDTSGDGDTGLNAPYASYRPETKWQALQEFYNNPEPKFTPGKNYFGISMRGFLYASSQGAVDTLSYFPQSLGNGKVAYITLDHPRSYYDVFNGDFNLFNDTLKKFAQQYPDFDPKYLDPSGDGIIENVTIIPDVGTQAPIRGNALSPHKFNLGGHGLSVGSGASAKQVANVNVNDTLTVAGTSSKVITHEFIHSLGIYDYYRKDEQVSGSKPVGYWDIMSDTGLFQPLAITRQDLGWTTIQQESQSGRFTLSELGSGGQQAIMFKSPFSDNEYFVAEYRKKGDYGQIDSNITGSGVIVYRVNPAYRDWGNWGKDDYIYVFRPGETGVRDAKGDIRDAQISLAGGTFRSSVGSSDMTQGITDGAIVLSDGRNTGIVVSAVEEGADSVTIDLSLPTTSEDDLWPLIGDESGSTQFGSDVQDVSTVSGDGGLYTLVQQGSGRNSSFLVMETREGDQGDRLVPLGNQISGTYMTNASLAIHQGSLYFLATNGDDMNQALLKRFDKASNAWVDVAQVSTRTYIQSPCAMASVADSLYVLVATLGRNGEGPQVYRLAEGAGGSTFEKVEDPLPVDYILAPQLFEFDGAPAIACGDNDGTGQSSTHLIRLTPEGSWSKLDLPHASEAAGSVDAVVHGGKLYLLAAFGNQAAGAPAPRLYVISPEGQVEIDKELSWLTYGLRKYSALEVSGDNLYVSAVMGRGPVNVVDVYSVPLAKVVGGQDLSSLDQWEQLGQTAYSPTSKIVTAVKDGRLYLGAVNEGSSRAVFVSHALLPGRSIISVTMPSSVQFSIDKGAADANAPLPATDGNGPATFAIRNNSSTAVRAFVSSVSVADASLVSRQEDLTANRSLMLGMGDVAGGAFAGWLPAVSQGAPATDIVYYPFNAAGQGVIEGNSSSPSVGLFGRLGDAGWEDRATFTVTPTFTVAMRQ